MVAVIGAVIYPRVNVPDPASLMRVTRTFSGRGSPAGAGIGVGSPALTYRDFLALHEVDTPVAAVTQATRDIRTADGRTAASAPVQFVTGRFFQVAGVRASTGRLIGDGDEASQAHVAVLSDDAWARLYGRSPAAIGAHIDVGGGSFEIVGVADRGFTGTARVDRTVLWAPVWAASDRADVRLAGNIVLLARLRSDADVERFRAQVTGALGQPSGLSGTAATLRIESVLAPARLAEAGAVMPPLVALLGAVVIVGLVNLAGFLLTTASARQREVGVRLSLGATRGRLVRQFLTESVMVGVAGAAIGALAINLFVPLLVAAAGAIVPIGVAVAPDGRTYVFLAAAAAAAAVLAGLAPVRYLTRTEIAADLSGDGRRLRVVARPERLRVILVSAQVALSVVLLVATALLTRGAGRARSADVGFDARQLLVASGHWIGGSWSAVEAARYWPDAIARVRAVPGVENGALARHVFASSLEHRAVSSGGRSAVARMNRTSPAYFATTGIGLVAGRVYSAAEAAADAPVALVSARTATMLWGVDRAIGRTLAGTGSETAPVTVIGVVSDAASHSLFDVSDSAGDVYRPLAPGQMDGAYLIVRTSADARTMVSAVSRALPGYGARRASFQALGGQVDAQVELAQVPSRLAGFAGLAVLILTGVGLQGLVALTLRQRLHEIAVRMALGATPADVGRQVGGFALRPVLWGGAAGAVGAFLALRAMSALLFGVSAADSAGAGGGRSRPRLRARPWRCRSAARGAARAARERPAARVRRDAPTGSSGGRKPPGHDIQSSPLSIPPAGVRLPDRCGNLPRAGGA